MSEEDSNPAIQTLLASYPPTDPSVLKMMADTKLSNSHYRAIGLVAASWAYLESVVDTWVWHFAGVKPEIGVCLTGQMIGPRPRLDAFIALVRHGGARTRWNNPLETLANDATALGEQRNRAVHDMWDLREPTIPTRREATARMKVRLLDVHVPTKDLIALAEKIYKLSERVDDIASAIFSELHTSPDTSQSNNRP
jgi:hypothetical protein